MEAGLCQARQGRQALHADWGKPVPPGGYQVCNSIWLLDDFTASNGATQGGPWLAPVRLAAAPRDAGSGRAGNQQQSDQKRYIRPQTPAGLSPAARFILDV